MCDAGNLLECKDVLVVYFFDLLSVDLKACAFIVLLQPWVLKLFIRITGGGHQICNHRDQTWSKARLSQHVHLKLFNNDQLIVDGTQIETLMVEHLALRFDQLHDDLHVVFVVIVTTLVHVINTPLDAQRLQDVPKVLLVCLPAVLVGQEDTGLCTRCVSVSQLPLVQDTTCHVGG